MEKFKETEVELLFQDDKGNSKIITITLSELINYTTDDFYEMLDEEYDNCNCINESQSHHECSSIYEDYILVGVKIKE